QSIENEPTVKPAGKILLVQNDRHVVVEGLYPFARRAHDDRAGQDRAASGLKVRQKAIMGDEGPGVVLRNSLAYRLALLRKFSKTPRKLHLERLWLPKIVRDNPQ